MAIPTVTIQMDPRLLDCVLAFTTEVLTVAESLRNCGDTDTADRLLAAYDRLAAEGGPDDADGTVERP